MKFAENRPQIPLPSPVSALIAELPVLSCAFALKVLNRLTEGNSLICTVPTDQFRPGPS